MLHSMQPYRFVKSLSAGPIHSKGPSLNVEFAMYIFQQQIGLSSMKNFYSPCCPSSCIYSPHRRHRLALWYLPRVKGVDYLGNSSSNRHRNLRWQGNCTQTYTPQHRQRIQRYPWLYHPLTMYNTTMIIPPMTTYNTTMIIPPITMYNTTNNIIWTADRGGNTKDRSCEKYFKLLTSLGSVDEHQGQPSHWG